MSTLRRPHYEVTSPFLELRDPKGHPHYLKAGDDLPSWVDDTTAGELHEAGHVYQFGMV